MTTGLAQTVINERIPFQNGQAIRMQFDYPELIKISTWDKNEISIRGEVSINNGENDGAFEITHSLAENTLNLWGTIKSMKDLPERITVIRGGQKVTFRDRNEWQKYKKEHGSTYDVFSVGPEIEITLEIMVPRNVQTKIESVYGMVEVREFSGPLTVEATYGGVDATLSEGATGELIAETNYGEIYTNLDIRFEGDASEHRDFHTLVSATPGSGPRYSFGSKYGNVYLRKAAN